MRLLRAADPAEAESVAGLLRSQLDLGGVERDVARIVEDVRRRGDLAVVEYAERLDGARLAPSELYVGREKLEEALDRADAAAVASLRALADRVRAAERPLAETTRKRWRVDAGLGVLVEVFFEPVGSAACYVPGGAAPYVSTAIMCGVAAREAGVGRLVAFVPPRALGDTMLAALAVAGFDGAYRMGGPYGVAALAYGTQSVGRVDKIVGPGGIYVTAAKRLVSKDVGIDMLAGPTELALYFEGDAGLEDVAWHLAAQAEHGDSSLIVAITTSAVAAEKLSRTVEELSSASPVFGRLSRALSIVVVADREVAVRFMDALAPEHVELYGQHTEELGRRLRNYGVLVEGCASSAINDYYSGANHVLPTMGWARWRGGLSVLDFVALRRAVRFGGSKRELEAIADTVKPIALTEGFAAHLESIRRGGCA